MALKTAIVKEKIDLTDDVIELKFKTNDPFNFIAGQFITIKINDQSPTPCFRAYSISSAPNSNTFEICVKVVGSGRGSNWLKSLKKDDKIEFIGPNGKFTFAKDPSKEILFIGTGTGIAPLKSMIESQLSKGNTQKMYLLFGVRHIKDIIYKEFFENLSTRNPNFTFSITLSQPESPDWQGHIGRVTSVLETMELPAKKIEVYICGLTPMIESVNELLSKKQIPKEAIHFEKYD